MSTITKSFAGRQDASAVPPLENGDLLNSAEFRRRWDAMPYLHRAELIEGIVYMAASIRHRQHGGPQGRIIHWLIQYLTFTPTIDGGSSATVGLDDLNDPQPDGYLLLPASVGGRAIETEDGYLEGPPALVAEVSASTVSIDRHAKFRVYQQHGVQEYIIWRVLDCHIDWFILNENKYEPLTASEGIYRSRAFPGLWLNAPAMIAGDAQQVCATLEEGLKSAEHAAFVSRLADLKGDQPSR